jgi:hypothetical protein
LFLVNVKNKKRWSPVALDVYMIICTAASKNFIKLPKSLEELVGHTGNLLPVLAI